MDVLKKVPVREQDAAARAKNFDEVCLGYNKEEAVEEATRCINCKNAKCIQGCPVAINIPAFIEQVKLGNIEEAYKESLFLSASWSVSWQTGQGKTASSLNPQRRSLERRSP